MKLRTRNKYLEFEPEDIIDYVELGAISAHAVLQKMTFKIKYKDQKITKISFKQEDVVKLLIRNDLE